MPVPWRNPEFCRHEIYCLEWLDLCADRMTNELPSSKQLSYRTGVTDMIRPLVLTRWYLVVCLARGVELVALELS